ncbi:MarR family winged helix-turn-helix transcriptional regulator [Roseospira visakhapatnamensis]|uniref:DNA-binding MarR family transcriptional regulator n=1 Tax=Roseospira visakhapatnamensis TaxID=390880 RepID=A0A7W6REB6_9PROT|nr:MarR family transcriptional regulator [Roseospira visakhapatnamensis]MBB4266966.1 DNA-binding MarR family transcriptional regulator [Roseospira visakhapatnamensis]
MSDPRPSANPLFLREEELRQAIEMLFFAYRDFTGEADAMLARHGFGRAHHRVIYFVGRHPMISVSDLLSILRITKQSLSRVLGQLVRDGFIVQHRGTADGRQRLLELTDKGTAIEQQLTEAQRQRIATAYRRAGGDAVQGFRAVLLGIMDPTVRARFLGNAPPGDEGSP